MRLERLSTLLEELLSSSAPPEYSRDSGSRLRHARQTGWVSRVPFLLQQVQGQRRRILWTHARILLNRSVTLALSRLMVDSAFATPLADLGEGI